MLLPLYLLGCSATSQRLTTIEKPDQRVNVWLQNVQNYRKQLNQNDPHNIDQIFALSPAIRSEVIEQFSGLSRSGTVKAIAQWLLDENGRNIVYDLTATLSPVEAFEQRQANCLSFTMLLVALAAELGVRVDYNNVKIPDTWSMDANLGMVFYRHVNAVLQAGVRKHVYDLAMELYNPGYPQKKVSQNYIAAVFLTNKAVAQLESNNYSTALHLAKLAVSYDPSNADLWVNLGVIKKRLGNYSLAEAAFLSAYRINTYSEVAVSNLERLYREQNKPRKAQLFAKQAQQARLNNPYIHYQNALQAYQDTEYRSAHRSLKRAIVLHNQDPRFFELQSRIAQQRNQYSKAVKSLIRAYKLSSTDNQRNKYASKAERVTQTAINQLEPTERKRRQARFEELQRRVLLQ